MDNEKVIFEGTPSQWNNFKVYAVCFLLCWLVVPIFVAIYHYFKTKSELTTITTLKIVTERGVFSREMNEILLQRVTDVKLNQSFGQRILGLSDISVFSTDQTSGLLKIESIHDGKRIWNELRESVATCRQNIKEIEQRIV